MVRTVGIELLEQKIEKAQSDVVKTKQLYEAAVLDANWVNIKLALYASSSIFQKKK